MTKTTDYQDGYNAGFQGRKDKSEMYARNWGYKAGSDYAAGYRKGTEDFERDIKAITHPITR